MDPFCHPVRGWRQKRSSPHREKIAVVFHRRLGHGADDLGAVGTEARSTDPRELPEQIDRERLSGCLIHENEMAFLKV